MKFKHMIFLTGMVLPVSSAFAQYAEDALRFSQTEQGLTSRFRALGGAQTALGGDASSLASNPAGLGLFTRHEISFTPDFSNASVKGIYLNTNTTVQKDRAGINQFALVFHNPVRKYGKENAKSGIISYNFGVAYNKTNNFNVTTDYGGTNPRSSFGDYLTDLRTINESDVLGTFGYDNRLVDFDLDLNTYFPVTDVDAKQQNVVYRTGNQSEVNLALGANFNNQFYFGGSIGLASVNFNADREFTEAGLTLDQAALDQAGLEVDEGTEPYLDASYRLNYRSNQETRGSGVNAKLGFIYRPSAGFRFGMSLISPTWYSMTDIYSEGVGVRFNKANGQSESIPGEDESYDTNYSLRTPYRLNGGVAFLLNQTGLITADVEYVDYASMHFSTDARDATNNTNRDIRDLYQGAVNFKIGTEIKLNPVMLRAGYNVSGNPYQDADYKLNTASLGLGYRVSNFSFDLTYTNSLSTYTTSPYSLSPEYLYYNSTGAGEIATIENRRSNIFATIGLRF
jgi:hypothetical protein